MASMHLHKNKLNLAIISAFACVVCDIPPLKAHRPKTPPRKYPSAVLMKQILDELAFLLAF